jgi:4-methyl-5(b-hydroxyethyl)-thiazole monophosphate biosynthesis
MGKKKAAPDSELDADGLVVQKYRSMVLVVVPTQDFGDECLRYARSSLYNVHVGTRVVSVQSEALLRGRLQDEFLAEGTLAEEDAAIYSGVIFAGGEGALELAKNEDALRLARGAARAGKLIGAWGHAVAVLAAAGLLKGRRVTAHPSIREALRHSGAKVSTRQVEVDDHLVTGIDESAGMRFGKALATIVGI